MPSNLRDTVISFADLAATAFLPGVAAQAVTTLLPPIADLIFDEGDVHLALEQGGVSTVVTTQTGQSYTITVTPDETPELFEALARSRERQGDPNRGMTRHQEFHGFSVQVPPTSDGGGVSILNGIIGVQW
ncbi:MAG: hypothetical protein SX243_11870 [Acidobacteriota bacterium]|nr:hypothetical protein [Acidobacteriota bacterium]